ncbi:RidA family protein [Myxococcota bacterium]|nr:RidA family protein [Myxococcota bacterium]MBU1535688.1 RidA family protein [Myxococcota bacterium]
MEFINTPKAPAAIGPYSQAVAQGGTVYSSGIIGISPLSGDLVSDTVHGQTRQVLDNALAILQEAGCKKEDVIKTTVFLGNLGDFATVNGLYAEFFGDHRPARSTVEVSALPKGALVELEFIAVR